MPEAKFHQKIAWFNFICCLMVIWTHSGNADLFFPELGQDAPWWHFQYPKFCGWTSHALSCCLPTCSTGTSR